MSTKQKKLTIIGSSQRTLKSIFEALSGISQAQKDKIQQNKDGYLTSREWSKEFDKSEDRTRQILRKLYHEGMIQTKKTHVIAINGVKSPCLAYKIVIDN